MRSRGPTGLSGSGRRGGPFSVSRLLLLVVLGRGDEQLGALPIQAALVRAPVARHPQDIPARVALPAWDLAKIQHGLYKPMIHFLLHKRLRDDHLARAIHHCLPVVALDPPLARLHHPAVRVGGVRLLRSGPLPPRELSASAPVFVAPRLAAPPPVAHRIRSACSFGALPLLAPSAARSRFLEPLHPLRSRAKALPATHRRSSIGAVALILLRIDALRLGQDLSATSRSSASRVRFRCSEAFAATRRPSSATRPSFTRPADLHSSRTSGNSASRSASGASCGKSAIVRKVRPLVRRQVPQRHILPQRLLDLSELRTPTAVRVQQHLHHHARVVRPHGPSHRPGTSRRSEPRRPLPVQMIHNRSS
jgi:hypothetical protein